MSERPTPETDDVASIEGNWDTKALRMTAHARKLERERDEAREERDIARLEFEEISNDLSDARRRIWKLEKQIEGLNNFANERFDEIQKVRKERDEARDDLEFRRELYRVQENYLELARKERDEARQVLREIAEASHFDNIGNWARNKAKEALK